MQTVFKPSRQTVPPRGERRSQSFRLNVQGTAATQATAVLDPSPAVADLESHNSATTSPAAAEPSTSSCPVLTALKPLPQSKFSSWDRFRLQFTQPGVVQKSALDGARFVQDEFLLRPALLVGDVDLGRSLMAQEGTNTEPGYPPSTLMLAGDNNVFFIRDRERHAFMRRLLSPAFRQEAVDATLPVLQERAVALLERWAASDVPAPALTGLKQFTFDVIARAMLGDALATEAELRTMNRLFDKWLDNFFSPFPYDSWPWPFHESMNARRELLKMLQRYVDSTRAQLQFEGLLSSDNKPTQLAHKTMTAQTAVLRRLLLERDEQGRALSDQELTDNLIGMLFAGHDTTASTLASVMHALAMRPDIMRRLRDEQAELMAKHGPHINGTVVSKMKYAEAVVREALRYRPTIAGVMRKASRDFELEGHLVPKDMVISIGLYTMGTSDPRWPESLQGELSPRVFNPDRFLVPVTAADGSATGGYERLPDGAQVPFGMGHRKCLGMALAMAEMKVFLAALARGYEYSADWNTKFVNFPMPRPANGLPVFVTKLANPLQ